MDQAGIIRDLLIWLESHLDQPLSLDNVAAKAGYSKWHLQRMFKDITGNAIGAYIRARRLSKAAVALRLTSRPILISPYSIASTRSRHLHAHLRNSLPKRQRCTAEPKTGAHSASVRRSAWVPLLCRNQNLLPCRNSS